MAVSNCAAVAGVTDVTLPLDDLPLTVFDWDEPDEDEFEPEFEEPEPPELELEEPELLEPDLLEPDEDEFEPEFEELELPEPEFDEPVPLDPEVDPLPLEDTLPATTTILANKLIPPVPPPELVIEPLAVIL